jgi:hypothetical protein
LPKLLSPHEHAAREKKSEEEICWDDELGVKM